MGNNGGGTTGTTVALGTIDFRQSDQRSGRQLTTTGANGYGVQFGNIELSEISGVKWNDLNGDGVFDPNEPTIEGWTVAIAPVICVPAPSCKPNLPLLAHPGKSALA